MIPVSSFNTIQILGRPFSRSFATAAKATGIKVFNKVVKNDPSSEFPAEAGRYHLYTAGSCPWAHRVTLALALKGIGQDVISQSVVFPVLDKKIGWQFDPEFPGCTPDLANGLEGMKAVYEKAAPDYAGRWTVPCLWDTKTNTMVNNGKEYVGDTNPSESEDIMRMVNSSFNEFAINKRLDLYPKELQKDIDALNKKTNGELTMGVYNAGLTKVQRGYDKIVAKVFDCLDGLETKLTAFPFLMGNKISEADLRVFPTIVRFDAIYYSAFKCNIRRISEYPHLHAWMEEIKSLPGVNGTINLEHIKKHYWQSYPDINPTKIIPAGPTII